MYLQSRIGGTFFVGGLWIGSGRYRPLAFIFWFTMLSGLVLTSLVFIAVGTVEGWSYRGSIRLSLGSIRLSYVSWLKKTWDTRNVGVISIGGCSKGCSSEKDMVCNSEGVSFLNRCVAKCQGIEVDKAHACANGEKRSCISLRFMFKSSNCREQVPCSSYWRGETRRKG